MTMHDVLTLPMIKEQRKGIFQVPTTDFSFKRIFGKEENKRFLIHFLNCFVAKYIGIIVDVEYLPTEIYGAIEEQKKVIFDIYCTDVQGRNFIIEMQRAPQIDYVDRTFIYWARSVSSNPRRGNRKYSLVPTYSVNILDFELPEYRGDDECFRVVMLKDQNNKILTYKVGFFYINLCNFAANQPEMTEAMRNWVKILKELPNMDENDYSKQTGIFRDVMDNCRISILNTMEKSEYDKSVLEYDDVQEALQCVRESYYQQGIEKGIEKGIETGRHSALCETAKKLLRMGVSLTEVSEATGLDLSEVQSL
ncbi:MAG: Rpn family recombination-promoting nuclease/putative transposase [Bacteroidales bacterium]|nr:Rpn family recombination-promoting nuclease/putative transposase [Bacteroidales bacterium]